MKIQILICQFEYVFFQVKYEIIWL